MVFAPAGYGKTTLVADWAARSKRRTAWLTLYDLDMAAAALVKPLTGGKHGTTYPDMTWEPKASFRAVAAYYGARRGRVHPDMGVLRRGFDA